ncbi:hypothetical protein BU14_0115s0005 [Porphyra umbilicalis]|uniref:Uncharacterized protein n=1 Tax=Porphyra umbilicalis TaxID=2786 RepID=A0A1X6PBL0_PORUM|nr:hypothetical protein BU14_0115s0005 [Porphyra umbilicalis]|eukprot:OSX78234.1 hypothetical protein BU14_0115s0005 [Porphyra umbilicalis]
MAMVDAAAGYRGKVACFELLGLVLAEISANGVAVLAGPDVDSAVTGVTAPVLPAPLGLGGGGTFLLPRHGGSRRRRGGDPRATTGGVPRVFLPRAVSRRPAVPARRRSRCLLRRFLGGARRAFLSLAAAWNGRAHPRLPKDVKTAAKVVSGGVRVVSVRVLAGGVLSVGWVGGAGVPPRRRGCSPRCCICSPCRGGMDLVVRGGRRRGGGRGGAGWLPLAGMPVLPRTAGCPACGRSPCPPCRRRAGASAPLSPAERAARAAAFCPRAAARGGVGRPRDNYVSGVNRDAPAQRLRGELADLTGVHVHSIVDVRRVGAATAVTLTATGVAAFVAALGVGAAAGVLTLLPGADPWSPAFLGPRRRSS